MKKILNTTNIWAFVTAFIFLSILVFFATNIDKKNRINIHLQNATQTFSTQYNTVYNSYNNMSKTAHSIIFDSPHITKILEEATSKDPKVVDGVRKKLYNLLENKYIKLTKLGFKQIHFHTKDNKSFLRMHKPEKFGDDLSDIRYSVKYVNDKKQYTHSLEAGRIVHGFRFVYPMSNENQYLGSVEFSISSNAFINSIEDAFESDIHFIVNKDIVHSKLSEPNINKYEDSIESPSFLSLKENSSSNTHTHIPKKIFREKVGKQVDINIKKEEPFSLYLEYEEDYFISTFLPLKNIKEKKTVAYIISYTKNQHIKKIHNDYSKINIVLEALVILILYFIYLLNKSRQKLMEDQFIIAENSKLDSMREMIGNIAHHWRQPLSVISTTASSLKVQHELDILKDEYLDKSLNNIVSTTKKLSNTIDGFRDYLTSQNEISTFMINDVLKKVSAISTSSIENNYIELVKNINYDKEITSYESTLVESIIKILNNSIEALVKEENPNDRFIFLDVYSKDDNLIISIKDSGGGIPENIIKQVFEPYFTTKHQAVGTGLGLYTVRSNITSTLHGNISVKNIDFEFRDREYKGAIFTITLPIKSKKKG